MTTFTIGVVSDEITGALTRLLTAARKPDPALRAIGEALLGIGRRSFETSTDPWGRRWQPNAPATIMEMLDQRKGNFRKGDGRLSAKGAGRVMAKRPLIGESGFLSGKSLSYQVSDDAVAVGSSAVYAAIQQFGGEKSQFPHLWGDIPARPFLPIDQAGQLAPVAERAALDILVEYLQSRD